MNSTTIVHNGTPNAPKESTDMLVWLAGLVFVGLAVAWLVVTQPWASDEPEPLPDLVTQPPAPEESNPTQTVAEDTPRTELESTLNDPLRMAGLAFEAGMLLQPESLSAWSLYLKAIKADPQDADAKLGLNEVADALIARATVAMEQDRTSDAAELVNTVLGQLPEHFDALELASALPAELLSSRRSQTQSKPKVSKPKPVPVNEPKIDNKPKLAKAAKSPRNTLDEASAGFDAALSDNRLLSPKENSARHYFEIMLAANGDDERVQTAQRALFDRLMNRTAEATASADEQAAQAWLVAAESLELDAAAVASARDGLEQRMIQLATARPIPVSDLTLLDYTPPAYPKRALDRNVQGWVDVEFTVTSAGTPTDVSVINASHERYFKEEAVEAVEEWRFEPRQVRGQLVDQRTFTRLSFKLE
jgi:TonB family protein